jgi:hypothetical protein
MTPIDIPLMKNCFVYFSAGKLFANNISCWDFYCNKIDQKQQELRFHPAGFLVAR